MKVTKSMIDRGLDSIPLTYWAFPVGACSVRDRVAVMLSAATYELPEPPTPPTPPNPDYRPGDWVRSDNGDVVLVLGVEAAILTLHHPLPKGKAVPWTASADHVRHATGGEIRAARGES